MGRSLLRTVNGDVFLTCCFMIPSILVLVDDNNQTPLSALIEHLASLDDSLVKSMKTKHTFVPPRGPRENQDTVDLGSLQRR